MSYSLILFFIVELERSCNKEVFIGLFPFFFFFFFFFLTIIIFRRSYFLEEVSLRVIVLKI